MSFDFTSFITDAGFVTASGWLAYFFALRKDEKNIQITQITEERTKWRAAIRELANNIVTSFSKDQEPSNELIAFNRAALVTSLNPKCEHDKKILIGYDKLKKANFNQFTRAIALLLKHDWQRVKWETTPIHMKPLLYCFGSKALE
jgi:hypothetical protein